MKSNRFLVLFIGALICAGLHMEAKAVRKPLNPLSSEQLQKLVDDARVIVTGTVTEVTQSRTSQPPLETIIIRIILTPDRIIKGDKSMKTIEIEESYQQFSSSDTDEKTVTVHKAGPTPPVGRYRDGERILVFLESLDGRDRYRPVGSGNHDAYLGMLQITSNGVGSDRYLFDEVVSGYAGQVEDFLNFIIKMNGE